jgi:hypothetical protein
VCAPQVCVIVSGGEFINAYVSLWFDIHGRLASVRESKVHGS